MDSHRDEMVKHISNKSTRDLKEMFNHVEVDHSGFIDNDEVKPAIPPTLHCLYASCHSVLTGCSSWVVKVHHFFQELGVTLSDMELDEAIKEMTPEGKDISQGTSFFEVLMWCALLDQASSTLAAAMAHLPSPHSPPSPAPSPIFPRPVQSQRAC